MASGVSRLAIYQTLSSECPSLCCARACMCHASVLFIGPLRFSLRATNPFWYWSPSTLWPIGHKSGEPRFATPCCNTSRATWSTPSEPPHKKPFFEVLSFSAVFGTGCCCQLVYFEFGVLHFRLPLYTRNGQIGEHVLLLWFLALVLAGCCCQLVCFEF